ncbi:cytidine deaminase [Candidatus Parcubacteria bacterium]|jgi:cytidine deaminase|nr:cytidine deaminase [Candidatus Parcubacteria bacterium]MBT7228227.1 cytidine deaminase [Candidatus Parcubacteria bacterium]
MKKEYLELIKKASALAKAKRHNDSITSGYVGCALLTDQGNTYTGVSIDADCAIGFCGEHSAIAQMITAGEDRIKAIVAVADEKDILPPCGRCRELIYQTNYANLDTEVILSKDKTIPLGELLPYNWQNHSNKK